MKKFLAVVLAMVMALSTATVAFASSDYNRNDISSNKSDAIENLSTEQIAGVVLDWVDRQIADLTKGFEEFNDALSLVDATVPTDLDGIIAYKDYISLLGGDFANLDTKALTTRTDAGSDIQFILNVISFVADNADIFGKVFAWEEGTTFDYGKVGEFITDPANNVDQAIVDFYNDYLIGNDIQTKFVTEIAREMGYEIPEGEIFDEVIDNGIKGVVCDFLKNAGLISDEAVATVMDDAQFDLKTTDVYTLVEKLFDLVLDDNADKLQTAYVYLCDNLVRVVLKTAFGYTLTVSDEAAPAAVLAEFNSVYTDKEMLNKLAGEGDVLFRAQDGNYYSVNAAGTAGKKASFGESFLNIEPPTVEICDANTKVGGPYTPTSADVTAYEPVVYTQYAQYIDEETVADVNSFGVQVSAEEVPEEIAAIIANGSGVDMAEKFVMKINGKVLDVDLSESPIEISFADVEAYANELLAEQIPAIEEAANAAIASAAAAANNTISTLPSMVLQFAGLPSSVEGSVTVNKASVALSYKGYSDEDTFVCEVTAVPTVDISYNGNIWSLAENQYVGSVIKGMSVPTDYGTFTIAEGSMDEIVANIIDQAVTNPVATIVVDNLNGTIDGLGDLDALMNFVDTDFDVDLSVLALDDYYDEYNGFVGQANRILCAVVKMVLSDEGYESLGLTEGGNSNLTANIEKICAKADGLLSAAKAFMDENDFSAFADAIDIDSLFASEHGFNAGMLYNLDFSDVENLYVCAIRMGCDMLVKDNSGLFYDLHLIVEDLDTLEQMAVGVFNYAMPKLTEKANELLGKFDIALTFNATKDAKAIGSDAQAKDYIMNALTDMAYDLADQGVPAANKLINDVLADLGESAGIDNLPVVAFELNVKKGATYEETLTNLFARFEGLTKGLFRTGVIEGNNVYEKISSLLNNFLPLGCMISNAGKNGANGSVDVSYIMNVLFNECLDGNFDNFLRMFEVKDDELAGSEPVTYVLIKTSKHMVDAVFPGTVVPGNTPAAVDCQETFTGNDNDIVIAANNMRSINTYKTELVDFALNLIREAGVLPFFASCGEHSFGEAVVVKATCTKEGSSTVTCTKCGYSEKTVLPVDKTNHTGLVHSNEVAPTCVDAGMTAGDKCTACGTVISGLTVIPATGVHTDADGDGYCDVCAMNLNPEPEKKDNFFTKIINFFKKIVDWFKNLFK